MNKITPFLWFNGQAKDAAEFYVSIFKNSRILSTTPGPDGRAFTVSFVLDGLELTALNGGPEFKFNEAVSFFVSCDTQAEVDAFWEKLTAGGEEQMCGWLKDKYGLSWQIVPRALGELIGGSDPVRSQRVMQALLKMVKIDIRGLEKAYEEDVN